MIFAFEGTDCAGKTTAAKLLSDKLDCELIHYSKPDTDPMTYFSSAISRSIENKNIVCDRFVLGEMIYAKVKKEESQWSEGDYDKMLAELEKRGLTIIFTWEYSKLLTKRHEELHEAYVSVKQMIKAQGLFRKEVKRISTAYPKIVCLSYKPTSNLLRIV